MSDQQVAVPMGLAKRIEPMLKRRHAMSRDAAVSDIAIEEGDQ